MGQRQSDAVRKMPGLWQVGALWRCYLACASCIGKLHGDGETMTISDPRNRLRQFAVL